MFQIWAPYLHFEGAKIIYVLLVLIRGFGGRRRFLTMVWTLILICICSLVFGSPICQILALYFDFEGAKQIHVL